MTILATTASLCPSCGIREREPGFDLLDDDSTAAYSALCSACEAIRNRAPLCFHPGCVARSGQSYTAFTGRFDADDAPLYQCRDGHFAPMTAVQLAAASGCHGGRADALSVLADPTIRPLAESVLRTYSALSAWGDAETRYRAQAYVASYLATLAGDAVDPISSAHGIR